MGQAKAASASPAPVDAASGPAASVVAVVAKSDGQRQLVEVRASGPEVAAACGVSKQSVACWRNGSKVPGPEARAKLAERYGIAVASWDVAVGSTSIAGVPSAPTLPSKADLIDREIAYVERIAHDDGIPPSVRVRYQVELNKLIVEAQKRDERERTLLQNPKLQRVLVTVLEACAPWPDAYRAVGEALLRLREKDRAP